MARLLRNNILIKKFNEASGKIWNGPFVFIQGADTQLGMIDNWINKNPNPGWEKEMALIKTSIEATNRMKPKPKFFVVCGDLVDALPGTSKRDAQVKDFKKAFDALDKDIPLVCVCGNHDVGDVPTPESIGKFRSEHGPDYFAFYVEGVMCISINSQYYEDRSQTEQLAAEQDLWLDEILLKAKDFKHAIVFQHIPWFVNHPDEEKVGNNNIGIKWRRKMLKKFSDAGVKAIFCGHMHENSGGMYEDMELIVTSAMGACLGTDESGLRVVQVKEDNISHAYYPVNKIPSEVS